MEETAVKNISFHPAPAAAHPAATQSSAATGRSRPIKAKTHRICCICGRNLLTFKNYTCVGSQLAAKLFAITGLGFTDLPPLKICNYPCKSKVEKVIVAESLAKDINSLFRQHCGVMVNDYVSDNVTGIGSRKKQMSKSPLSRTIALPLALQECERPSKIPRTLDGGSQEANFVSLSSAHGLELSIQYHEPQALHHPVGPRRPSQKSSARVGGATNEVEEKRRGIHLYNAYDLWTKQKEAYLSQQMTHSRDSTWYNADEEFAVHLLEVHAKFCNEPLCSSKTGNETGRQTDSSSLPCRASSPPSHLKLNLPIGISSTSRHENASNTKTTVTNADTAASAPHEECATSVTVSTDEAGNLQNTMSEATQHGNLEQIQVKAEECFVKTVIKTEPQDPYEEDGPGSCQVNSDSSPGVSCDQMGWITDMTYEVKYEDDPDLGEPADHQLGGPNNIPRPYYYKSRARTTTPQWSY